MTRKQFNLRFLSLFLLCASFTLPSTLSAKTLVLIHGHLSDGRIWRTSNVTQGLVIAGWKEGGGYGFSQQGIGIPKALLAGPNAFFTVELPSTAPIAVQVNVLSQYLEHLYAVRKEPIIFVGHSVGGVVARAYLVTPTHVPSQGLITISAPHLGTPVANAALLAGHSPMGMMLDMVGQEDITDSRGLYQDLKKAAPNTFLGWLNTQRHPQIPYVSIIRVSRSKTRASKHDFFVPPNSQNMNNVWALQGQSVVYSTQENHFLSGKDGLFLVDILKHIIK